MVTNNTKRMRGDKPFVFSNRKPALLKTIIAIQ
jgi:hypothetical protein